MTSNNTNGPCGPFDEKSLKLQDLEKTTSLIQGTSELVDKLRTENSNLNKKIEILEKEHEILKNDSSHYMQQVKDQATLIN